MRVLFDQGTPAPLRHYLHGPHAVTLAIEMGWATLKNGELLKAAEAHGFDALLTTDKNFRYQQNLTGFRLAIVVLPTTSWPKLRSIIPAIASALESFAPGTIVEVPLD